MQRSNNTHQPKIHRAAPSYDGKKHRKFLDIEDVRDMPTSACRSTRSLIADSDNRDVLELLNIPYMEM